MLLMLVILIFLTLVLYYVFLNRDFMSPSVVLFVMFIFSAFFGLLGNKKWNVEINIMTYVAVITGLIAFAFGEIFVDIIFHRGTVRRSYAQIESNGTYFKLPHTLISFFFIFGLVVFYIYFKKMNLIALSYGYSGGLSMLALSYAKSGLLEGANLGKVVSISVNLIYGLCYISIFAFCYNVNIVGKSVRKEIYFLLPVVPALLCHAVSGSRNGFITIIVYSFFCFFLLYYKTHTVVRRDFISLKKVIFIVGISFIAFYGLFQLLGIYLGKTGIRTPLEMLYLYAGSSIPALGKYLGEGIKNSTTFGSETFVGIVNWGHRLLGTPEGVKNLEHVRFSNSSTTNIYTCFREYIDDFGYAGSMCIMFFNGFLHKYYYNKIKKRKSVGILYVIYSYFMYYHVSSIFAASTTIYLLSSTQLSQFIWIVFFYCLFIKCFRKFDIVQETKKTKNNG